MKEQLYYGWHQVAFTRELAETITPLGIGTLPLVLVRDGFGFTAYDAVCPHRGAHLGYGGKLSDGVIVCPFHGRRIGLGCDSPGPYKVRGYRTMSCGGLVFVLLDQCHDNGFGAFLQELDQTHFFVPGFTLNAKASAELVIENGFDRAHFQVVHSLKQRPELRLGPSRNGELNVEAHLLAEAFDNLWHRDLEGTVSSRLSFRASVFSPNLCATTLGDGELEYVVISGATPNQAGGCTIRVSVAAPRQADGKPPDQEAIRSLLRDSKLAYEQDLVIWEHRINDAPSRFADDDDLVLVFHQFCQQFQEAETRESRFADQLR